MYSDTTHWSYEWTLSWYGEYWDSSYGLNDEKKIQVSNKVWFSFFYLFVQHRDRPLLPKPLPEWRSLLCTQPWRIQMYMSSGFCWSYLYRWESAKLQQDSKRIRNTSNTTECFIRFTNIEKGVENTTPSAVYWQNLKWLEIGWNTVSSLF